MHSTRSGSADGVLAGATIDPAVAELRPDYRVMLIIASGITGGPGDAVSESLLEQAEAAGRAALARRPVEDLPQVAAWREAYRAFGAKPQRTRNSLEALLRRTSDVLPRINRLTDVYNAISVIHQLPLGGEDADRYRGAPRLLRAAGSESFDTMADGEPTTEHPEPGEVVWADDHGVTCRRWNWRQGVRTRLTEQTETALFIVEALAPCEDGALVEAVDHLSEQLQRLGADVQTDRRLLRASDSAEPS